MAKEVVEGNGEVVEKQEWESTPLIVLDCLGRLAFWSKFLLFS